MSDTEPVVPISRSLATNVRVRREQLGITQGELAEALGKDEGNFSRMLKAGGSIKVSFLDQLAEALQVKAADLLDSLPVPVYEEEVPCGPPAPDTAPIPPASWVRLGDLFGSSDELFVLPAVGHSMSLAGINPGDQLVIRRAERARLNQLVLARIRGAFTVKRYVKNRQTDEYGVISCDGKDTFYPLSEGVAVVGVVTGIILKSAK